METLGIKRWFTYIGYIGDCFMDELMGTTPALGLQSSCNRLVK